MQQIALVLACLAIGVALRLSGRLPDNATQVLGGWVINVALPASAAFHSVHNLTVRPDWWLAVATPWLDVVFAIAVIVPLAVRCTGRGNAPARYCLRAAGATPRSSDCRSSSLTPVRNSCPWHRDGPVWLVSGRVDSRYRDCFAGKFEPIQLARGRQADRDLPAVPRDPDRFRHQSPGPSDVAHGDHRRTCADVDTARDGGGGLRAAAGTSGGRPPRAAVRRAGLPAVAGPVGSSAGVPRARPGRRSRGQGRDAGQWRCPPCSGRASSPWSTTWSRT